MSEYLDKLSQSEPIRICIDLDGTIINFDRNLFHPFFFGELVPLAKETMIRLREQGYYIIIHTARPVVSKPYIEEFLNEQGIPFDEVFCGKPFGVIYFDDRTLCGADWELLNKWIDTQLDSTAFRVERLLSYYNRKSEEEGEG